MAITVTVHKLDSKYCKNYATPTKAEEMVRKAVATVNSDIMVDVSIHAQVELKGIRYYPIIRFRREADFSTHLHVFMPLGFVIAN